MKLTAQQVAGNTWCIVQPRAMVPYYQLSEQEIILLDSGCMLHGELEEWLEGQGLRVRAILNTHDHWDHVAANAALQQRQGSRIYLPRLEAAAHASPLAFKAGHENGNYRAVEAFWQKFPYAVDEEIGLEDGPLEVCGAVFDVIHTPGHSVDHVAFRTPDDVLYVGDTLMSGRLLRQAKLSYALSHEVDLDSKEKLRRYHCAAYILAHGSIEQDLEELIDENLRYIRRRAETVWRSIEKPMSMEQIIRAVWKRLGLHADAYYYRTLETGNMIRSLVQLLCSEGRLEHRFKDGVEHFNRAGTWEA